MRAVPRAERGSALGAAQVARYLGYSLGSAAIQTASAAAFLAGTAVAGAGLGTGFFLGAYRILTALASPGHRAGLVAAILIVYYLAFSVPVVIAGVATTRFGLHQTAVVYSAALAVLAAAAAGIFLFRRRSQTVPGRRAHRLTGTRGRRQPGPKTASPPGAGIRPDGEETEQPGTGG